MNFQRLHAWYAGLEYDRKMTVYVGFCYVLLLGVAVIVLLTAWVWDTYSGSVCG